MRLQERIVGDLQDKIHNKNKEDLVDVSMLKVIVGEFQRQEKKVLEDGDVIRILRRLEKSELELLGCLKDPVLVRSSEIFLRIVRGYIPAMISEAEVEKWIKENIDFSKFKNKMQVVGVVLKHFGSVVDGSKVKLLIQRM